MSSPCETIRNLKKETRRYMKDQETEHLTSMQPEGPENRNREVESLRGVEMDLKEKYTIPDR